MESSRTFCVRTWKKIQRNKSSAWNTPPHGNQEEDTRGRHSNRWPSPTTTTTRRRRRHLYGRCSSFVVASPTPFSGSSPTCRRRLWSVITAGYGHRRRREGPSSVPLLARFAPPVSLLAAAERASPLAAVSKPAKNNKVLG